MKKLFLVLLFPVLLFGQHSVTNESNYVVYNKYNYGFDFQNIQGVFNTSNGCVIVNVYHGESYKISNFNTQLLKCSTGFLAGYFEAKNNIEYFCFEHKIEIFKDNKFIKTIDLKKNSKSRNYVLNKNKLYFTSFDEEYKKTNINYLENNTIIKIHEATDEWWKLYESNDKLYAVTNNDAQNLSIYEVKDKRLFLLKKYPFTLDKLNVTSFVDENNFSLINQTDKNTINIVDGKSKYLTIKDDGSFNTNSLPNFFSTLNLNENKGYLSSNVESPLFNISTATNIDKITNNAYSNSYYCGSGTKLFRVFPHITKYPRLYNSSNSNMLFSVLQDNLGNIWAGSYQGFLSVIDENKRVTQSKITDFMFMNSGLIYKDKVMLFSEYQKGVLLFKDVNNYTKIADSVTAFYSYVSKKNKLYLGTLEKGVWYKDFDSIENQNSKWNKITNKNGLALKNTLSICEDEFGTIWFTSGKGIAFYKPKTNECKTWLVEKNEIDFGSITSLLDKNNTLWFGNNKGELVYYNGKSSTDYDAKNFVTINHPLLKYDTPISFLHQWNDYLILGVSEKVLLFDLKKWYHNKTISVRYLNPLETNFTATTEQNSIITDKRDESIWLSTTDNLYQFDIKKWLTLPTFKVTPTLIIKKDSIETICFQNKTIEFNPTQNSFDVVVNYQTKDNMPRYINGILVKKGENPVFENPNLETKFHFANLSNGEYVFYIRVCQQDGSFDVFEYPIVIHNFLWQNWWFWALISLVPIGFLGFFFDRKKKIEQQKRKLSQLNLSSLSNQFRPHFMLNALNSIGSQMDDKPHAEKVISRLGESITILYGFTQKNDFTHSFANEWKLVENIIEIQKLLFIPNLETSIKGAELINENYKIPVGLIQIPVENALLHGLRNNENRQSCLQISIESTKEEYHVSIKDNGVGREKAAKINNFKNNGNGLKTILEMLKIININQNNAIDFSIIDLENNSGTLVTIKLKKEIDYGKIKL